jgi:hypothetical protein
MPVTIGKEMHCALHWEALLARGVSLRILSCKNSLDMFHCSFFLLHLCRHMEHRIQVSFNFNTFPFLSWMHLLILHNHSNKTLPDGKSFVYCLPMLPPHKNNIWLTLELNNINPTSCQWGTSMVALILKHITPYPDLLGL